MKLIQNRHSNLISIDVIGDFGLSLLTTFLTFDLWLFKGNPEFLIRDIALYFLDIFAYSFTFTLFKGYLYLWWNTHGIVEIVVKTVESIKCWYCWFDKFSINQDAFTARYNCELFNILFFIKMENFKAAKTLVYQSVAETKCKKILRVNKIIVFLHLDTRAISLGNDRIFVYLVQISQRYFALAMHDKLWVYQFLNLVDSIKENE